MVRDTFEDGRKSSQTLKYVVKNIIASSTTMALIGRVSAALNHSVIKQSIDAFSRFTRASVLYRWMTETPDEITVDLNQAAFGAPVARLLVFATETYPAAIRDSTVVGQYYDFERTVLSAPLRILGIALLLTGLLGLTASLFFAAATQRQTLTWVTLVGTGLLISRIETSWGDLSDAKVVKLWQRRWSKDN